MSLLQDTAPPEQHPKAPPEPDAKPSRQDRWRPGLAIRLSLGVKKWFPPLAQAATLAISLAALYVIEKQAFTYDEQRILMSETKAVMAEQTAVMAAQTKIIQISERAYVGVGSVTPPNFPEREVTLLFQNFGHIPAETIKFDVWQATRKEGSTSSGSIQTFVGRRKLFPGVIGMPVVVDLKKLRPTDIADIKSKRAKLYIIGDFEYDDGFGPQKTDFAYEYKPPPNERWTVRFDLTLKK